MDLTNNREKRAVLVIDGDRSASEKLKNLFGERGYLAYSAGTTEEALKLAQEKRVVVAFLTLGQPGLDSGRLIRHLKRGESAENIPVIVILESYLEDLVASALKAGAVDYLIRPIDSEELIRRTGVHARLKEDNKAMAESLERYKEHFGGTEVGLFFTSRDGELLDCNETLVKMLGYELKDELLHRNVEETIYFNPLERSKFRTAIEDQGVVKDFRVTFRRKGGDPVSILISGHVERNDDGAVVGYRGENVIVQENDPPAPRKGLLSGLLPMLSGRFHSLFSASELLGDRYEKVNRLGLGSFGEVWKVRDIRKDPPEFFVAKIPLSKKLNAKFEKEAHILKSLAAHDGVPKVREIIDEKNKRVLIQELILGKTLFEITERELEEKEAESVIIQLIDVVAHAHNLAIIHRDIKPGNVMVKPDGRIMLLDFGAAKELKERSISDTVTGSRPFMSPEQIMGRSQRRSDVWALGVVMFILYTGMFPFYNAVEKVLMDMILELPPPHPSKLNESIHPEIERIILQCLEKPPENRHADAGALKDEIISIFPDYGKKILPLY
ncbi:MAG: protein kinase [Deltaproteobacteria bacterium]|nr:protein kinase [Deltaproteobacteria bacterium]